MFRHACAMGLKGIVSKKVTAPYLSGRRSCWRKIRIHREAESGFRYVFVFGFAVTFVGIMAALAAS